MLIIKTSVQVKKIPSYLGLDLDVHYSEPRSTFIN